MYRPEGWAEAIKQRYPDLERDQEESYHVIEFEAGAVALLEALKKQGFYTEALSIKPDNIDWVEPFLSKFEGKKGWLTFIPDKA